MNNKNTVQIIHNKVVHMDNGSFNVYNKEEGSNTSFFVSIMSPLFKFLIAQSIKLKYQNKIIRFDLDHFIYV
jgi:hypothetical protein